MMTSTQYYKIFFLNINHSIIEKIPSKYLLSNVGNSLRNSLFVNVLNVL